MKAYLTNTIENKTVSVNLPGSKSESNRLLILKKIYPNISLLNLSNCDDTLTLRKAIEEKNQIVDVHHAGTAMRFLTAFFASKKDVEFTLTGSKRMQERPIKILVDTLRAIGADISYIKNNGFPPLKIKGKELISNSISIDANISSQYISALMLIAPSLNKGLKITLRNNITSIPYIKMTLELLSRIGVFCSLTDNIIEIASTKKINDIKVNIESDWSSASYYYSLVALSDHLEITLKTFRKDSIQGDSKVVDVYKKLGVETIFNETANSITLKKNGKKVNNFLKLNLIETPDIAQTIAVTCFGLGISCELMGLKTLKIKETDRLLALKIELQKLGAEITITDKSLRLKPTKTIAKNIVIETYQDHRMAMSFAPLYLKVPIIINNPNVVSKSYKTFWEDLQKIGSKLLIK
ncbi:MAG: 3-phosphoshikimate 1-carboxyvinyltransferase [Flavobacteriales bacterium]|nr:MAG: 3-phosphoshikimate 1-carboxyvinyltransferase [Flavobacteriales bacterium]